MNSKIRDVDLMAEAILKNQELIDAIERKEMEMIDENIKLQFAIEQIAKKMKKANKPIEEIMKFTGLSKEEIEKL